MDRATCIATYSATFAITAENNATVFMPKIPLRRSSRRVFAEIGTGSRRYTRLYQKPNKKITLELVDVALSNENSRPSNAGLSPSSHANLRRCGVFGVGEAHRVAIAGRLPCRERSSRSAIIFMDRPRPSEYYAARSARRPLGEFCGSEPRTGVGIVERSGATTACELSNRSSSKGALNAPSAPQGTPRDGSWSGRNCYGSERRAVPDGGT
jgi:hypothetical protein